jgi:peptidase MA superfamily protein
VFDTATKNPYHDPPHWLNEGLAVYLSQGYGASDRNLVEGAAKDGSIMPLDGLIGAFPTTRDRFFLAYAESVSAVDWIVANKGSAALIGLIKSYADGVSDDEAFKNALGLDAQAFQQAWLSSVGATAPVRHGPVPAPVGPLPQGWSGPAPNGSPQPGATVPRGVGATPPPGGSVEQPAASGGTPASLLIVGAVTVVLVAGAIYLITSTRRTKAAARVAVRWDYGGGYRPPTEAPQSGPPSFVLPADDPNSPSPWARPASPGDADPAAWSGAAAPAEPASTSAPPRPDAPPPDVRPPAPAESPEPRPPAAPEP